MWILPDKESGAENGNWDFNLALLDALKLPAGDLSEAAGWVKMKQNNKVYEPQPLALKGSLIPDVHGMGARDAVYLLEKSGLRVHLSGSGESSVAVVPARTETG